MVLRTLAFPVSPWQHDGDARCPPCSYDITATHDCVFQCFLTTSYKQNQWESHWEIESCSCSCCFFIQLHFAVPAYILPVIPLPLQHSHSCLWSRVLVHNTPPPVFITRGEIWCWVTSEVIWKNGRGMTVNYYPFEFQRENIHPLYKPLL